MFVFINTEKFIERANLAHNFKYDYSKSVYKSYKDDVIIICPVHGEFIQNARTHMRGNGCMKCGQESRIKKATLTTEIFISRAIEIHDDRYDYSFLVIASFQFVSDLVIVTQLPILNTSLLFMIY